jgi:pimeloyl-ACP methyl ester carboxylesterase
MPAIELSCEHIPSPSQAERRAVFLHGILGRGSNLRTLARRFVAGHPGWDAWLVDLRGHGASPKGTAEPTIAAAAQDVLRLCARAIPIGAIIGHSFGGKVALQMAQAGLSALAAKEPGPGRPLVHVMTLDSNPGTRVTMQGPDSALAVLQMLDAMPQTFPSRSAFVEAVVRHGRSPALAQWLATSTEPAAGGSIRFALDRQEIHALLASYLAADLWPVVEAPPQEVRVHLVIGERSSSYAPADRDRAHAAAAANTQVTVDLLPTDHWVHTEDLEGLLRIVDARI